MREFADVAIHISLPFPWGSLRRLNTDLINTINLKLRTLIITKARRRRQACAFGWKSSIVRAVSDMIHLSSVENVTSDAQAVISAAAVSYSLVNRCITIK